MDREEVRETIVDEAFSGSVEQDKLHICQRLSYSLGHVLNDLCASVWFTYMLIYFQDVLELGSGIAGNLMLVGQVVDAVSNPLIGMLSDGDSNRCIPRLGRRRRWHLVGTFAVAVSFPLMLHNCPWCSDSSPVATQLLYYIPLVILFQFGWASTQISHLALIPELTNSEKGRLELNALRYGWTVLSNIIVYGVAWGLFGSAGQHQRVGSADKHNFEILGLVLVGFGLFTSFLFYIGTPDPTASGHSEQFRIDKRMKKGLWKSILLDPRFFTCAFLYMSARLIVNLTQVYVPFFVTHTLDLDKYTIATYPLVTSVFSFITAVLIKFIAQRCSSKMLYFWGALNVIGASLWMAFLQPHLEVATFGTAVLSGMGGAAIVVTSLSIVSELIGTHTEIAAFVFGAMGFADKLANGIAVFGIQTLNPCQTHVTTDNSDCTIYIRYIISIVPGVVAGVSILVLAAMAFANRGSKGIGTKEMSEDEVKLLE